MLSMERIELPLIFLVVWTPLDPASGRQYLPPRPGILEYLKEDLKYIEELDALPGKSAVSSVLMIAPKWLIACEIFCTALVSSCFEKLEFGRGLREINRVLSLTNRYFSEAAPWKYKYVCSSRIVVSELRVITAICQTTPWLGTRSGRP